MPVPCSTISMPKPSMPATLRERFVSRRMFQVQVRENLHAETDFALGVALAFGQCFQSLFVMELQRQLLAELFAEVSLRGLVQIDERAFRRI